jgi:hypothetical protein
MKKILLVAVAMLFAVSIASASMTRLAGMGLSTWMVDDDANIWFSPAYINDYPNKIWGDLGTGGAGVSTNQWGGASLRLLWGWLGNAGLFYSRPYTGVNGVSTANVGIDVATSDVAGIPGGNNVAALALAQTGYAGNWPVAGVSLATLAPANKIDFLYGFALGSLLKIGVGANLASNYTLYYDEYETAGLTTGKGSIKNERSTQELNLSGGITLCQLGPIPQLDIVGVFGLPMVTNSYREIAYSAVRVRNFMEDAKLTNAGAYNLNLMGRAKLNIFNLAFIVYGRWGFDNLPSTFIRTLDNGADSRLEANLTQNRLYTSNTIQGAIALNHKVSDKTLVVLSLGATYNTTQNNATETDPNLTFTTNAAKGAYDWSRTTLSVPINIGIEHQLPWFGLVGRAGLAVTYAAQTTTIVDVNYYGNDTNMQEFTTITTTDVTTPIVATLGLGKQVTDTLSADLLVRQTANTGLLNSLTTQMTLTYQFK